MNDLENRVSTRMDKLARVKRELFGNDEAGKPSEAARSKYQRILHRTAMMKADLDAKRAQLDIKMMDLESVLMDERDCTLE